MDIATLGLTVNADGFVQGVNRAEHAVDRLAAAEKRRTQEVRSSQRAEIEAYQRAERALIRHVQTVENTFRAQAAAIKDSMARGFITPAEAERAGRRAAEAYNRGITKAIDFGTRHGVIGFAGGGFTDPRSQAVYTQLAGSLKNVSQAGQAARVTLNTVRSSMTSLAASALGAVPGVTNLTSAIGAMALGSAWMIGIMAGVAALGLAWNKLREPARRAKEEFEELKRAIESAANARIPESVKAAGRLTGAERALGAAAADLVAAQAGRRIETAQGGVMTIVSQREIEKARERFDEAVRLVRLAQQEITAIQAEETRKREAEEESARRRAAAAQEAALREQERRQREHDERMASMARYRMILERERLFGTRFTMNVPGGATSTSAGGVTRFGDGRVLVGGNIPREMTAVPPGPGLFGRIGGFLGGVAGNVMSSLNPMMIASNLASQALGKIAGGVGKFVGGLLGFGSDAEKAAERMRRAQRDFIRSLQDFVDGLSGAFSDEFLNARRTMQNFWREFMTEFQMELFKRSVFGQHEFPSFNFIDAKNFEEMQKFIDGLVAQGGWSAEALAALRLMSEAIKLAAQGAKDMSEETAAAADAIRGMTNVLNGPEGLRLSLLRWRASQFGMPQSHLVAPVGGVPFVNTTRQDSGTVIFQGDVNLTVKTDKPVNGEQLLDEVLNVARRRARASGRNPLTTEVKAR